MKIKLVKKANPADRDKKKYYANAVNAGKKELRAIADDIAGRSSLTKGDVENVLSNLIDRLPMYLNDGFSVQLGHFGTMRISLSSDGAESPEQFKTGSIKPKIVFTPGTELKKQMEKISYETVESE
ncbi:DNA-binding protein [Porphyromonadaceae bacterium COT-184 OH4590]|nr:DNA-binding protein [Porphyromonadaceae bacterium COT-184 OH4590]